MAYDSLAVASARQLLGDGFLLLASLSWSSYGVLSRRLGLPAGTGAAMVAVLSLFAFLPIYAFWPGKALLAVGTRELLLQAIVQGVLIGAVSIFVYTRAVAALGPAETALFASAVPFVTTLAAIPLLSEYPSPRTGRRRGGHARDDRRRSPPRWRGQGTSSVSDLRRLTVAPSLAAHHRSMVTASRAA